MGYRMQERNQQTMTRHILYIVLLICALHAPSMVMGEDSIPIPLRMSAFKYAPMDSPIGSTPDPTDPNQFTASIIGGKFVITTQSDAFSYVVIRETQSETNNEDYFYSISTGKVECPITRTGTYAIEIGYWKNTFVGHVVIWDIGVFDINGKRIQSSIPDIKQLQPGVYFIAYQTSLGNNSTKIHLLP